MFNKKFFELGGIAASIVLIAFGIGAIALGLNGRSTVRDSLKLEQIVGSPDMTRDGIAAEAKKAGLTNVVLPGGDVAGQAIDTGQRARWFAGYMRIHALEASGGLTYAQMPRFATADGKGTNDAAAAQKYPSGAPMSNSARNLWVTETALTTALNTSYMAEQLALFGMVVGIALLLSGIGFGVLTLGGALKRRPDPSGAQRPVPVPAV
jgi:F0F1-type ATP synthase membrane subunit c/vacuolar-type H+-ATPase subunit K